MANVTYGKDILASIIMANKTEPPWHMNSKFLDMEILSFELNEQVCGTD